MSKLKRFWIRKVLGKVYNENAVLDGTLSFDKMNNAERIFFLKNVIALVFEAQKDIQLMTEYLGNTLSQCDKCDTESDTFCFKCEGFRVVQNRTLCSWPWE